MMRKHFWLVFALVFVWKIALLVFTGQPVPANDAFFYDGGVIHHLLHGGYYNPTLTQALPISGREVYSTYPPLYQGTLLLWLSLFGVSALKIMSLHLFLFGVYLVIALAILRRLQTPAWCVNMAGAFLFALTFQDRPDSLAHCFGLLAVYAWVRSWWGEEGETKAGAWPWWMALFAVLTLCTSLQIGGIYFAVIFVATLAAGLVGGKKIPLLPLACMLVVPLVLVLSVKLALPRPWAGFHEHLHQTPSYKGFQLPGVRELLKITRTVPGILLTAILLPFSWRARRIDFSTDTARRGGIILLSLLLGALGVVFASLFMLTANTIAIANYLQPLIVALYLSLCALSSTGSRWLRIQLFCFGPAIMLGAVRAVGMSTWGVACAADVNHAQSAKIVEQELAGHPRGWKVVMSSALLYDAAKHNELDLIHSDWLAPAGGDSRLSDSKALLALKPEKILLTQFDYYRRYEAVLSRIKSMPALASVEVINTAHTRAPDSYKSLQQVVQNISWAPVIINLHWQNDR